MARTRQGNQSQVRPIHYAALPLAMPSAAHLERWLIAPVSAHNHIADNKQTVLGIVKTAEFLGVRWRTDPARAERYASLLEEMYGPDHDAFQPAFPTAATSNNCCSTVSELDAEDLHTPSCRIQ
jgi:hypothetical protein